MLKQNASCAFFCFFIGNFSCLIKQKTLREDAHLAEKKLAANSTARARKSRKRLFVLLCDVASQRMALAILALLR